MTRAGIRLALAVAFAVALAADVGQASAQGVRGLHTGFDISIGGGHTGAEWDQFGGIGARLGYAWEPVRVIAEVDGWLVNDNDDDDSNPERTGFASRVGVVARTSLFTTKPDRPFSTELWVEAGAGWQRLDWHDGGGERWPDFKLGVGWQLDFREVAERSPSRRFGGYIAVSAIVPRADFTATGALFSAGYVWLR